TMAIGGLAGGSGGLTLSAAAGFGEMSAAMLPRCGPRFAGPGVGSVGFFTISAAALGSAGAGASLAAGADFESGVLAIATPGAGEAGVGVGGTVAGGLDVF